MLFELIIRKGNEKENEKLEKPFTIAFVAVVSPTVIKMYLEGEQVLSTWNV